MANNRAIHFPTYAAFHFSLYDPFACPALSHRSPWQELLLFGGVTITHRSEVHHGSPGLRNTDVCTVFKRTLLFSLLTGSISLSAPAGKEKLLGCLCHCRIVTSGKIRILPWIRPENSRVDIQGFFQMHCLYGKNHLPSHTCLTNTSMATTGMGWRWTSNIGWGYFYSLTQWYWLMFMGTCFFKDVAFLCASPSRSLRGYLTTTGLYRPPPSALETIPSGLKNVCVKAQA